MIVLRDRRGRVWARRLDVAAAVRMRDIADLDVMALAVGDQDDGLAEIAKIVDALYAVMLPDLGRTTPYRFGRRLRAMPAEELRLMVVEAVNEFFALPGPPRVEVKGQAEKTHTARELWRELWRMAGAISIDPGPLTFGEVATMAEGHRRDAWERNACLMEAVYNSAFGSSGAAKAENLDPTGGLKEAARSQSQTQELTADNLGQFAAMMMGR